MAWIFSRKAASTRNRPNRCSYKLPPERLFLHNKNVAGRIASYREIHQPLQRGNRRHQNFLDCHIHRNSRHCDCLSLSCDARTRTGAEKTAERQLRAYIYIHPVTLYVFKVGAHPAILLSAKNYGTTLTRNGRVRYGFAISPPNDEQDYTVPEDQMVTGKQPLASPPKETRKLFHLDWPAKIPLRKMSFCLYHEQHHVVVLKGTFIYEDIF